MNGPGKLYIVATPIGNPKDITLRAVETLKAADVILCEEWKPARRLFKQLDIEPKELIAINEHNEEEITDEIVYRLVQSGEQMALISDCGTPVFSDPGHHLIARAVELQIPIVPIPGVSSLMTTLSILNFNMKEFVFGGFLPREKNERSRELTRLRNLRLPVVLMDTPYRMTTVVEEAAKVFGKGRQATLACDLTKKNERIYRGTLGEILAKINNKKAEFMLVIHDYRPQH